MKGNPLSQKLVPKTFGRLGAVTSRPSLGSWLLPSWQPREGQEEDKWHCEGPCVTYSGAPLAICRNLCSDELSLVIVGLESRR